MPNLKDIRRRIKSVKNTQKITQAMRMVAAAKVKRAENRVKASRPFCDALNTVFAQVLGKAQQSGVLAQADSPLLQALTRTSVKRLAVVVVSSDRGLCGAFNTSVIRQAFRLETQLLSQGIEPVFFTVGRKITQALKKHSKSVVAESVMDMTAAPSVADAETISKAILTQLSAGDVDGVVVLSSHFKSMISFQLLLTPILPLEGLWLEHLAEHVEIARPIVPALSEEVSRASKIPAEMVFEPSAEAVLTDVVPMMITQQIFGLMLESAASELAARMTAMANATSNARDMIDRLTIVYNKARQAAITQEILEVVSGANALV